MSQGVSFISYSHSFDDIQETINALEETCKIISKINGEEGFEDALEGKMDNWENNETGCLALIIVLDQFARNMFRHTPRSFTGDKRALDLSIKCCEKDYLKNPDPHKRLFMLMPMMHSENLAIQDAALPLFKKYTSERDYDYAEKHRAIIGKFGRFPHRNFILGRESTKQELEFLKQPGSSF